MPDNTISNISNPKTLSVGMKAQNALVSDNTAIHKDIRIIDFNDWPSFAPCRTEAAPYIAQCIEKRIREKVELIKLNNIE